MIIQQLYFGHYRICQKYVSVIETNPFDGCLQSLAAETFLQLECHKLQSN